MKRAVILFLCACGPTLPSESTSSSSGADVPQDSPPSQASSSGLLGMSSSGLASESSGSSEGSSSGAALDTTSGSSTGCEQDGMAYRACDPACDCSDGMVCRGENNRALCTFLCETADECPPTGFPPPWDEPICIGTCAIPCSPSCPNPGVYACTDGRCLPLF